MITFQIKPHSDPLGNRAGANLVEILMDGKCVAVIYAKNPNGLKVVSAHMDGGVNIDDGSREYPHIPHVDIVFDPKPYSLSPTGHILRHDDDAKRRGRPS
jgi:hypothetical protein